MTTTTEPWNFTEPQRRQFREAHAEATRREAQIVHTTESECLRCHIRPCACCPDCGWAPDEWCLDCDACGCGPETCEGGCSP
jgi:hypothetical protein